MKIFNSPSIPKNFKGHAIAIGNFDGVHKGHQKVFNKAKKYAKIKKIKFGVLTFSPLPVMFFNKRIKNFRIASEDQKLNFFKKNKVDFTINIEFNKKFSKIEAKYWKDYGKEKMNLKLKVNFGGLYKEKNQFVFNGFIWIILISGLIMYYQLIPDIILSLMAGIMISGLTYLAIFGINVWRKKNEIQKLKDEKKES